MRLGDLLIPGLTRTPPGSGLDREITGLSADSRAVKPGFLFAALPGTRTDGRAFLPQAADNGAAAVLVPDDTGPAQIPPGVAVLRSPAPHKALALIAARFHGRQPEVVTAVTGTNGKTSTAVFTRQLWARLGVAGASMGTLGLTGAGFHVPGKLTTPDPVTLHRLLTEAVDHGCTHLCMEASSHGLAQHRLDGVTPAAAAFTNLSRDHLDYHGTEAAYLAAKARLFTEVLAAGGTAVLNADTPEFAALAEAVRATGRRVMDYGTQAEALRLERRQAHPAGQTLDLAILGTRRRIDLPLVGGFQAMNALAALGLVLATGADTDAAAAALEHLDGVPGRLELVGRHGNGAAVYVDYAHTPDALETVLAALRPHAEGKLVCLFGCGGDRDRGKRPLMGRIAARLADHVIVTDDNPRSEDPATIRREVLAGCPGAEERDDRRAAIHAAVAALKAGDVLLLAGKGHETGQIVGDSVLPFDDRAEAQTALDRATQDKEAGS